MATATQAAPIAPVKPKPTAPKAEPREYIFQLLQAHPEYYIGSSPRALRFFAKKSDDILWAYVGDTPLKPTDKMTSVKDAIGQPQYKFGDQFVEFRSRSIRYVSGLNTIFVDEQESDGRPLAERITNNPQNSDKLSFHKGELRVQSFDKTLFYYLWCMNQCQNQHPNARKFLQVNAEFKLVDFASEDQAKVDLGKLRDNAYEIARTARVEEMLPHAKYLNISFTHSSTDEPKDIDAIREDYKDRALTQPKLFMDTFNDPRVKVVYQIKQLMDAGKITLDGGVNQAHWVETGTLIANFPPDAEDRVNYLADFSMTKQGEEFANNLRGIANNK